MIVSYFLLRQKVSKRALIAIMVGSFGCVLMSWAALTGTSLDPAGVLFALSSGFFLGMFYIGSDVSITKGYDAAKYMFYMMATAMIISIFFTDVPKVVSSMSDASVLVNSLILGILMTLVPYYISAWAVKYLGALTVSVISVTEVVFATLVGVLYFNEPIGILDMIGILMMILSVVMISVGSAVQEKKDEGAQST
jgi:drug/metabolite transporter (DMT)-like permease